MLTLKHLLGAWPSPERNVSPGLPVLSTGSPPAELCKENCLQELLQSSHHTEGHMPEGHSCTRTDRIAGSCVICQVGWELNLS